MRPIDGDQLADMLSNVRQKLDPKEYNTATEFHIRDEMLLNLEQIVRMYQTIEPVNHAEWEPETGISVITRKPKKTGRFVCSLCHFATPTSFWYCPGCGARMDADLEDTEATT